MLSEEKENKIEDNKTMNPYWEYQERKFDFINFDDLQKQLQPFVAEYEITNAWTGETALANRISCVFLDKINNPGLQYYSLNNYDWTESEIMNLLKNKITEMEGTTPNYCLVHFYRTGTDYISYHNDKESLNNPVYSVSFGEPRKFRLRKMGSKKGFDQEYLLGNGDLLIMKTGCQKRYVHGVPVEKKVKSLRINMTFRYTHSSAHHR